MTKSVWRLKRKLKTIQTDDIYSRAIHKSDLVPYLVQSVSLIVSFITTSKCYSFLLYLETLFLQGQKFQAPYYHVNLRG